MKLFKWNTEFKPKFPKVIEKFLGKRITDGIENNHDVSTVPSVNIADAHKAFEVNIALPGLDKKDVNIEIENNCLVIKSEKQYSNEDKTKNWIRREFGYASFQRIFELPEDADPDKVQANLKNGILTIKVGKKDDYIINTKKISVQ